MSGFEQFVAYEASAGSGKTFALTLRYISLLFLGNSPNKILTLTFTNKASNEMKSRIQKTLKNLDKIEYEIELKELSKILNIPISHILKDKDRVYKKFLREDNYILTIDSFLVMILRRFAFYVGLMPDFTIEQKNLFKRIVQLFMKNLKKEDFYEDFINFSLYEQKKLNAVFDILYYFYEKLFNTISFKKEIDFDEDLVWRSFKELKDEILKCEKLSKRGRGSLEADTIEQIAKKSWFCKESLGEYSDFKKCYDDNWDIYFDSLKDSIRVYFLSKEARYINNLLRLFFIFKRSNKQLRKELNDLSFLDISNFTYDILNDSIDKEFFYFRLDAKFDHILIDEFQDTSLLQFEILKPIFDEIVSGKGDRDFRSIFYVGDVKQSIYRFRGGSKELFYEVAKRYKLQLKRLNVNYRSKKEIVEFVNDTFSQTIKGYFKQEPNDKMGQGYVEVLADEDIATALVKVVQKLLDSGICEDDIAVLTYTNDDALMLEERLSSEFKHLHISTQSNVLMKNHHQVKIIIECFKYAYFKEELYLQNLLAMLGWDELEKDKLDIFSKELSLIDFAYFALEMFSLDSEVVLSFMQELLRYADIEEFVFNLDDFNIQIPQKEIKGLKILTIHKSKGLEFKHLIVCDRLKRKSYDRSSFILFEDGLKVEDIYLKITGRECVDKRFATIKDIESKLSYEDEINAKYVAFTRAKESLFVLKKEKSSAFSDLCLKECSIGIFPQGFEKKQEVKKANFEYEPPIVSKQNEIITLKDNEDIEDDFEAIEFGLATHYMLEMMDDFKLCSIQKAYEAMSNKYLEIIGLKQCAKIKSIAQKLSKDEKFSKLIKDGDIYKELALKYHNELKQIDLLVKKEDSCIVIDYKTSSKVFDEHIKQVEDYVDAISDIFKKPTEGYLCYLREDDIKIVEVKSV